MANSFHVVPHGEGWAVKKEGVERAHSTHETQKAAIDAARDAAKEGDEIVIHRTDGTIREQVTYTGAGAAAAARSNGNSGNRDRDRDDDRPRYHDIWSVGTRVRWSAILAGVAVALGTAALLTAFAAAIQIPLLDDMKPDNIALTTAIAMIVVLLASMFLGGFVASRMMTRETMAETIIYGTLVWATFAAISTFGLGAGARLGLDVFNTVRGEQARTGDQANANRAAAGNPLPPAVAGDPNDPNERAKAANAEAAGQVTADRTARMSSTAKGWLAFTGLLLPLLAAIGGALAGCGEDPTRRVRRDEIPEHPAVENRISAYERSNA